MAISNSDSEDNIPLYTTSFSKIVVRDYVGQRHSKSYPEAFTIECDDEREFQEKLWQKVKGLLECEVICKVEDNKPSSVGRRGKKL